MTAIRSRPGPRNWVQALFTLEAVAREAGDWELADWAATEMLADDPRNAGSHYAAALVAEHNEQADRARRHSRARERPRRGRHADADLVEPITAPRRVSG